MRKWMLLLSFFSFPALAQLDVDKKESCDTVLLVHKVRNTDPTYAQDAGTCEEARKTCAGVRMNFASNCSETMGQESKLATDYAQAMMISGSQGGTYNQAKYMSDFCAGNPGAPPLSVGSGYMTNRIYLTNVCNKIADICRKGKWQLSNGEGIVCDNFHVVMSEYDRSAPKNNEASVCYMADQLAKKVNEETAGRQTECMGYAQTAGASASEAAGINANAPINEDYGDAMDVNTLTSNTQTKEAAMDALDKAGGLNMVESDADRAAVQQWNQEHPNDQFPARKPMPEQSVVSRFFSSLGF